MSFVHVGREAGRRCSLSLTSKNTVIGIIIGLARGVIYKWEYSPNIQRVLVQIRDKLLLLLLSQSGGKAVLSPVFQYHWPGLPPQARPERADWHQGMSMPCGEKVCAIHVISMMHRSIGPSSHARGGGGTTEMGMLCAVASSSFPFTRQDAAEHGHDVLP
jgi:hypothetical protein